MRVLISEQVMELLQGDVTVQQVDAVVNAANQSLAGGGGVDGAIHRCGGPQIMAETDRRYPDGCPTGSAVISGGGQLAARHVIHAVGPIWRDGTRGEPELLALAYRTSLQLAIDYDCDSVAFPSLSTGAYRYPIDQAARIAVSTVIQFLQDHARPRLVRFVLFDDRAFAAFEEATHELHAK